MPEKLEHELNLIYEERIGDFLFLLGTLLAFASNFQAENSLLRKPALQKKFLQNKSAVTIASASWLFFLASILFTYVSVTRLKDLDISHNTETAETTVKGTRLAAIGNIVKFIGFGITAIAYQLKAIDTESFR